MWLVLSTVVLATTIAALVFIADRPESSWLVALPLVAAWVEAAIVRPPPAATSRDAMTWELRMALLHPEGRLLGAFVVGMAALLLVLVTA